MMDFSQNIFLNKKILIYGLGKSGISSFKFLKKTNKVYCYDDFDKNIKDKEIKKKIISHEETLKTKFDRIILSPGININKCKLSRFLKKNQKKIYSDLDIFYSSFRNDTITITGTNGKSTTCKLLLEVFKKQNYDARLVGNIGYPILSSKNIKSDTLFIIEASSYQLEYSKIFRSSNVVILNLAVDHLERHKTLNNYVKAKFKLLKKQNINHYSFLKKEDLLIKKHLKLNKYKSNIIKVDTIKMHNIEKKIQNNFFLSDNNKENLKFVLEIAKKFNLKKKKLIQSIQSFKGLKYRQEIIFKSKKLIIINDSKSTSFSSTINLLKNNTFIHWLVGGIPKKGDKFNLSKKYHKNLKAYIFGKDKKFFLMKFKNKIQTECFDDLQSTVKKIFQVLKISKNENQIVLFSPSAASFDSFRNFEERGLYFNKYIKKYLNEIK